MPGRLPYDLDIIEEWAATQKAKSTTIPFFIVWTNRVQISAL